MLDAIVRNHLPIVFVLVLFSASAPIATGQVRRLSAIEHRSRAVVLVAETSEGRIVAAAGMERALTMRRASGSLFKLPIAVALLRSGHFDPLTPHRCNGREKINGVERTCWIGSGHGDVRFVDALSTSCNLYFRTAARMISRSEVIRAARDLGMYHDVGSPSDAQRILGDDQLLEGATSLTPGDLIRTAVVFATRGRVSRTGQQLDLRSGRYDPLYRGLRKGVVDGTSHGAWTRRFTIAGKTGTAPLIPGGRRSVGWFIGFAPIDHPRFAVVVAIDDARGSDAATLAREALEQML